MLRFMRPILLPGNRLRAGPGPQSADAASTIRRGISRAAPIIATAATAEARNTAWIAGSSTPGGTCSRSGTEPVRREATTPFAIAPKTATPTELPTERVNIDAPVATPRNCQVTDD